MKRLVHNKAFILYLIFVLLILGLIFYFSSNNGVSSSAQSGRIVTFVMKLFRIENNPDNFKTVQMIIRKLAHFSLFALLGMGLCGLFSQLDLKRRAAAAMILGFAAACGDEIHQLFVPGRSGMFTDVLIDMLGVISGILITILMVAIFRKFKNKNDLGA